LLFSLLLRFLAEAFATIRVARQQATVFSPVIASEAKQSSFGAQKLDCFVAALLAMTLRHVLAAQTSPRHTRIKYKNEEIKCHAY
jgi:hypothetical protein